MHQDPPAPLADVSSLLSFADSRFLLQPLDKSKYSAFQRTEKRLSEGEDGCGGRRPPVPSGSAAVFRTTAQKTGSFFCESALLLPPLVLMSINHLRRMDGEELGSAPPPVCQLFFSIHSIPPPPPLYQYIYERYVL